MNLFIGPVVKCYNILDLGRSTHFSQWKPEKVVLRVVCILAPNSVDIILGYYFSHVSTFLRVKCERVPTWARLIQMKHDLF